MPSFSRSVYWEAGSEEGRADDEVDGDDGVKVEGGWRSRVGDFVGEDG